MSEYLSEYVSVEDKDAFGWVVLSDCLLHDHARIQEGTDVGVPDQLFGFG